MLIRKHFCDFVNLSYDKFFKNVLVFFKIL